MARLVNTETGELEWVAPEKAAAALKSGKYSQPEEISAFTSGGAPVTIPGKQAGIAAGLGYREASPKELVEADIARENENKPVQSFLEGAFSTAVPGGNYLLKGYQGGNRGLEYRAGTTAGKLGQATGYLLPGTAASGIVKGGGLLRGAIGGLEGAVVGTAAEGAALGAVESLREQGLSNDPFSVEKMMAHVGTGALVGGAFGGIGYGLSKAAKAVSDGVTARLLNKTDSAVPTGQELADEVLTFRENYRKVISDAKRLNEMGLTKEAAKMGGNAARAFGVLKNKPETLAENPAMALDALQLYRSYAKQMLSEAPTLRKNLAEAGYGPGGLITKGKLAGQLRGPEGGARWRLLDNLPQTIEESQRLTDKIKVVRDAAKASSGMPQKGLLHKIAEGLVFGAVTPAARGIMGPGAAFVGGYAARAVTAGLPNKLANLSVKTGQVMNVAAKALFTAGSRLGKAPGIPLTSKALLAAQYATKEQVKAESIPLQVSGRVEPLRKAYNDRVAELKTQVMYDPMVGGAVLRPSAHKAIGKSLLGVRAEDKHLADAMETVQARKIEFLANKIPKNPGIPGWQASKGEMSKFARYILATEDPGGIMGRMAKGQLWPEDVETLQTVWPELYKGLSLAVMVGIAKAGGVKKLPLWKRIMLSMFTGSAIEPALQPNVLMVLQGQFAEEPNTDGGTSAPPMEPNFGKMGSVSKEEPTSAQGLSS